MRGAPIAPEGSVVGIRGLDLTPVIGAACLQHGFSAVPPPRKLEPRKGHRKRRILDLRITPGPTAVDRDFNSADRPVAGPGKSSDLVIPMTGQPLSAGWRGDHGLRSLFPIVSERHGGAAALHERGMLPLR